MMHTQNPEIVSPYVTNLIKEYLSEKCNRGEPVKLLDIGEHLAKKLNHNSPLTFKVVAQLAFQHKQLPGYVIKRGFNGGVYRQ